MHSWPDTIIKKLVLWLCCLLAHLNPVWDHLTFENIYGPFPMQTPYIGSPLHRKLLKAGKFKLQVGCEWWLKHEATLVSLSQSACYFYHSNLTTLENGTTHLTYSMLWLQCYLSDFLSHGYIQKLGNNHLWVPYHYNLSDVSTHEAKVQPSKGVGIGMWLAIFVMTDLASANN